MMVLQHDFNSIAKRMRYRARGGEFRGGSSDADQRYIKKCSTRAGRTTLIFTRDVGNYSCGWLAEPAHERCLHLSISCDDRIERDAWLRAFFGDEVEALWGEGSVSALGQQKDVWHWRLFCDEGWSPVIANDADLLAAGMRPARDLGIAIVRADLAA
jgi:hypothetical protein